VVAVVVDTKGFLDALPLAAQIRVVPHGEFVLGIFGLGFDQILVASFLDLKFVAGYGAQMFSAGGSGSSSMISRCRELRRFPFSRTDSNPPAHPGC